MSLKEMSNEDLASKFRTERGDIWFDYRQELLRRLWAAVSASPRQSVKRQTAREWIKQTGEFDTELYSSCGKEMYDAILAVMSEFGEYVESFAAAPAQEPRLMITRSGEIHEWCPDCRGDCCSPYKAAQEQPVENSPQEPTK